MAYYHPRTAAETSPSTEYARVLETTAREVRKIVSTDETKPVIPDTVKNLHDLLFQVILNNEIPVDAILSMRSNKSARALSPQLFEGMWTIAFALGLVRGYENNTMYKGKIESGIQKINRTKILDYLRERKVQTSSIEGASDITFALNDVDAMSQSECSVEVEVGPTRREFVFCSSKFYGNEKSVDDYDITNILAAARKNYKEGEFRIVLLVKNKDAVKSKFASAVRRYITYIVRDDDERSGVLGRDDLEAAFVRLREYIGDRTDKEAFIQNTLLGQKEPRPFLSLRFHQELIVQKTIDIHKTGSFDSVLWGVVARGGKTYMCGGLIRELRPKYVFIVAGAYTETHTQFTDALLDATKNGFQDFADYKVVDVKKDPFTFDKNAKYIFFISAELLKAYVEGKTGKKAKERAVMSLVGNTIVPELVFFDEVHKGGTTDLADDAMLLISSGAFKVFMTATYNKLFIKDEYKITTDNFLTWGYEDIQTAKAMESEETVQYFGRKYGEEVCQRVLKLQEARGTTIKEIAQQYQKFPEIQFLTTSFSEKFRESMTKQNILDPTAGFRMQTLMAIGKDCMKMAVKDRYKCFTNPASVAVLLNYVAPASSQITEIDGVKVIQIANPNENITNRIGRTSQLRGDILKNIHTEFKPHSQLWFLPQPVATGTEGPLISMMTCLASMLFKHPWFSKYFSVVCVSSGFTKDDDIAMEGGDIKLTNGGGDTKQTVLSFEKEARKKGRGLIILAGRMLTLGVSLPCVNIVSLFDDSQSSDLTYQKMFRALTESEGKKVGYIVDVNPLRTLKTLYDYTTVEHDETGEDPVTSTVLTNLYLIDEDQLFVTREDGSRLTPKDIHERIDAYLQATRKVYKSIVDEASKNIETVDLTAELAELRDVLNPTKPMAVTAAQGLTGEEVPTGKEVIKEPKEKTKKEKNDEKERLAALREMVLTSMTLLAFLTTASTFAEAFELYKTNVDEIQDIVFNVIMDRGLTSSTDKEKVTNVIIAAIAKVQGQLNRPYGKMKKQLSEYSGDQKEVIEFIEQNLKPKKEQVASRGEVFTPLSLVEDMLSHLPEEVWTHPEYKWLDPANGIGNFPVIAFAKLDAGLATWQPDETIRRRHIVENMLYMVELDQANVALSRKLLEKMCGSSECKFNLLKQDFLVGDLRNAFGVDGFHVCMGNPPYNPPKTETGASGNNIWPHFVMKMDSLLVDGGYIVVVHPPGWKKPTEAVYNPDKFKSGDFKYFDKKQNKWKMYEVQQGQVWQYLKNKGSFDYVYTNDSERSKSLEHWPNFPAVDYYIYKKGGQQGTSSARNIFRNNEYITDNVVLSRELPFIPCLITPETMNVVEAVVKKPGAKPTFQRFRSGEGFAVSPEKGPHKYIYTFDKLKQPKFQYSSIQHPNLSTDKIVMSFDGGIDTYTAMFVPKESNTGSYEMTTYYDVSSPEEGTYLEEFYKSDIVKFVFLITQYSYGKMTKNEPLVANSITIPPIGTTDYYKFFGIEEYKPFIEKVLTAYESSKSKTRTGGSSLPTPRKKKSPNATLRNITS